MKVVPRGQRGVLKMNDFEVGDSVRCVDNEMCNHLLKEGASYVVSKISQPYIWVEGIPGEKWFTSRFILIENKSGENNVTSLADLNDLGKSFTEIADIIEAGKVKGIGPQA